MNRARRPHAPPDLYRAGRPDRLYRLIGAMAHVYGRGLRLGAGSRPPVVPVDRRLEVRVEQVRNEADGVVSLRLGDALGRGLPGWRPGAHLDVVLPSGRTRQYSLCGDPADRAGYRIAVRRIEDGHGSREVHEELRPGSRLRIRGPRNAFPLVTAERYLFVAGGIGITPILPMVHAAAASGADWRLVYTGRSRASMPFLDELAQLDRSRVWVRPDDEYGIPVSGRELLESVPASAPVYCCGPAPLLSSIRTDLVRVPHGGLHCERFSAPPVVDGAPFRVDLARSGRSVRVPADRSALAAIREVLPDVAYSCQQGFCGTCRVRVLGGRVEHRDHVRTGAESVEHMMICVSRARDDSIELDL